MKYTNKDFYEYIIKSDTKYNPLHNIYIKIINLFIREGLDKQIKEINELARLQNLEVKYLEIKDKNIIKR